MTPQLPTDDVSAVADAVTETVAAGMDVFDHKNTPEAIAAAEGAREQAAKDKTNHAIAEKDTNEIRNEVAE